MMAFREFVIWRPQGRLGELVPFVTGYRETGLAPGLHRGLPSPYLTVIVTLDERCEITQHPDPAQPGDSFDTVVGGLHTTPAVIRHGGAQSGVHLSRATRDASGAADRADRPAGSRGGIRRPGAPEPGVPRLRRGEPSAVVRRGAPKRPSRTCLSGPRIVT